MVTQSLTETTGEISPALAPLHALAQLLQCVDEERWASLARPSAEGLSRLLFMVEAEVEAALPEA